MGILTNLLSVLSFTIGNNPGCPIIFLDFDGVLSTDAHLDSLRAAHRKTRDCFGRFFDPKCVDSLKRIVETTGARIVITSSWRNYLSIFQFILLWQFRKMPGILAGITPKCSTYRGDEIDGWLKKHKNISRYVILDDMDHLQYNTAAKSNRFGTQDKPNKNVIRTWATTQEKSIQRISRPK